MRNTNLPDDRLWKRQTALFLLSQNISLFGSSVAGYAVVWHITLATSSGFWLMAATLCSHVPLVLISPWGGVWADRYDRRRLIIAADACIAAATLALAVLLAGGRESLPLLLLVLAARSAGTGVQSPAVNAAYPQLVPPARLANVQGINQSIASVCLLAAPAAGGALLGSLGLAWALMVDVLTAAAAIAVMGFVRLGRQTRPESGGGMLDELREGLAYAFGHPRIRRLLLYCAAAFFLFTPAGVLTPLMIERSFGGDVWRLTANEAVWTVGSLIGGIYVSCRGGFRDKARALAVSFAAFGVLFGMLGVVRDFASYLLFMGLAGFFLPLMITAQTVLVQELCAPEIMGRVFSLLQLLSASAMPAAILLFGPLADVVRVESILCVTGALLVMTGAAYGRKP